MPLQDIDKIADLFSGYFADQDVTTGARKIALVYSQTWEMQQQIITLLHQTERLIGLKDVRLIEIFTHTCLFITTQDTAADFNEIRRLVRQIKAVIHEYWQNPNDALAFDKSSQLDPKVDSIDDETSLAAASAAISYLLDLTPNRADIDAAQINQALDIGKMTYSRALSPLELDFLKRDIMFLLACGWDTLTHKKNRRNTYDIVRRMLM